LISQKAVAIPLVATLVAAVAAAMVGAWLHDRTNRLA
jgi:hypothetical protein